MFWQLKKQCHPHHASFDEAHGSGTRLWVVALWCCWLALAAPTATAQEAELSNSNVLSLAQLRGAVVGQGANILSFQIQGTVCAKNEKENSLALQDQSGGLILQVPEQDEPIQPGDVVSVIGTHCAVTRNRFGLQLGTAPAVNNDGHHPVQTQSGKVFLDAGMCPIRVTWFNGEGAEALRVAYEGPGVDRQAIPAAALFHKGNGTRMEPGLDYAAYNGSWYYTFPDFPSLTAVAGGVATNFDLRYSVRAENTALAFTGYLSIATAGIYTFYVDSDDGAYLYAGNPGESCQVKVLRHGPPPAHPDFESALADWADNPWVVTEGEVVFAGQNERNLELELIGAGQERVQATVIGGAALLQTNLLHRRVWMAGILEVPPDPEGDREACLMIPGPSQVQVRDPVDHHQTVEPSNGQVLTSMEQIRHLTRTDAARGLPARVKGVVIWNHNRACVLHDLTGGVYIQFDAAEGWVEQPTTVGDLWEIEGTTDPGSFSPIIIANRATFLGNAAMPVPIRPSGDQLLNGSLDSEYVELRGALTEVSEQELTLLTAEGTVKIIQMDGRPLPQLPSPGSDPRSLVDSIVRIRGCALVHLDNETWQVHPGEFYVAPGSVEVDEWAPSDPFGLPTRRAADLLLFNPSATALQLTKIKGQIVLGGDREFCLQDGSSGLRLSTKEPAQLEPGDIVEAVGFPKLGGPSPILQEARVRIITRQPLPAPAELSAGDLLNGSHDSTLVRIEAMLLEDRLEDDHRTLELQAGQFHFTARLNSIKPGTQRLAAGSRLQVTGVYFSPAGDQPGGSQDAFQLWLTSPADITVLDRPSWWTLKRVLLLAAILAVLLLAVLVWNNQLQRKVYERGRRLETEISNRQQAELQRATEAERARIARDLHDELGTGLTEVTLLAGAGFGELGGVEKNQDRFRVISEKARALVLGLDFIVWAIDPKRNSLQSFADYLCRYATRLFAASNIVCRFKIPIECEAVTLTEAARHSLFLAVKEALNNVIRHSSATEVELQVSQSSDRLHVIIADNGRGFDYNTVLRGNGLTNLHERLEALNGQCQIGSIVGKGTTIELIIPLPGAGLVCAPVTNLTTSNDQNRHYRRQ